MRYLGVGVGRVADIRIDPRDSGRVGVIADIDARTPISADTVAELQLQGVTGLLYIDLFEDREHRRLTTQVPSLQYPVIRSSPSRFDDSLPACRSWWPRPGTSRNAPICCSVTRI